MHDPGFFLNFIVKPHIVKTRMYLVSIINQQKYFIWRSVFIAIDSCFGTTSSTAFVTRLKTCHISGRV